MAGIFSFECACCGQIHEGSPSFGFEAPDPWLGQDEETRVRGKLSPDLCTYTDEDGQHFFIRVVLEVPIHGVDEPFLWGVWVSLSEKSFDRYVETYDDPDPDDRYFGWLCNEIPCYESTYALAMDVHPRVDGDRPCLVPHEKDHALVRDFRDGLTIARAQALAEECMHRE